MKKTTKINSPDSDNIENLFREYYQLLCLVSFAILKDKDASKDVVQDFFMMYWQKRNDISIRISFKAYATKSVRNLSLLAIKKDSKEKSMMKNLIVQNVDEKDIIEAEKKPNQVFEAIDKLPESRREIFISSALQGYSYKEIAESHGISINTVKTQIKRSYVFLRTYMKEDLIILSSFIFSIVN